MFPGSSSRGLAARVLGGLALAVGLAALAFGAAGCGETGLLIEVSADPATGPVDSLDLNLFSVNGDGHMTLLDLTEGSRVNLNGRDLSKNPYTLLIQPNPAHRNDTLAVLAIAASRSDELLRGQASDMVFQDGVTVRYRIQLAASDSIPLPELAVGAPDQNALGAFCPLDSTVTGGAPRLAQLCSSSCSCADFSQPGCGYLPGGTCSDYDGDGCPNASDPDPTTTSADCGTASCTEGAACQVGTCPGQQSCGAQTPNLANASCRVDTRLDGCANLSCSGMSQGVVTDTIPCFVRANGCQSGTRACKPGDNHWTCVPSGLPADPVLCPSDTQCEVAFAQGKVASPAACLTDPMALALMPGVTLDGMAVAYARLIPVLGCTGQGCQLDVDLGAVIADAAQGHGIADLSAARCCLRPTNAQLDSGQYGCDNGPKTPCDQIGPVSLEASDGQPWYLAILIADGGDLHRFVAAFDPTHCSQGSNRTLCQAVPAPAP